MGITASLPLVLYFQETADQLWLTQAKDYSSSAVSSVTYKYHLNGGRAMEWTESCKIEGDQNRRFLKGCVEPIAAHRLRRLFLNYDLLVYLFSLFTSEFWV